MDDEDCSTSVVEGCKLLKTWRPLFSVQGRAKLTNCVDFNGHGWLGMSTSRPLSTALTVLSEGYDALYSTAPWPGLELHFI